MKVENEGNLAYKNEYIYERIIMISTKGTSKRWISYSLIKVYIYKSRGILIYITSNIRGSMKDGQSSSVNISRLKM